MKQLTMDMFADNRSTMGKVRDLLLTLEPGDQITSSVVLEMIPGATFGAISGALHWARKLEWLKPLHKQGREIVYEYTPSDREWDVHTKPRAYKRRSRLGVTCEHLDLPQSPKPESADNTPAPVSAPTKPEQNIPLMPLAGIAECLLYYARTLKPLDQYMDWELIEELHRRQNLKSTPRE